MVDSPSSNDTVWVAGIAGVVIGLAIAGVYVAYTSGWFSSLGLGASVYPDSQTRAAPMLQNKETIKWTDNKGRLHIIEVDREVS